MQGLSHSSVFIFFQIRFIMESTRRLLGKSVSPLVYATAVEFEGFKVVMWCPVLKRECVKNSIYVNFDS